MLVEKDPYGKLKQFIDEGDQFLIATHINPDGDGIGSMLAVKTALDALGKKTHLFNEDPVPDSLKFLPGADAIATSIPNDVKFDSFIMVDCAEPKRAGKDFAEASRGKRMAVVDHHLYSELEGAVMCLDKGAASTGEVVWRFVERLGVERTPELALCIYTTLVVDTGFFRYSNTTSDVLSLAAELVRVGADPWTVARNLDESYSAHRLALLGQSLNSLQLSADGRYAHMDVTRAMLDSSGAQIIDSDEFATFPRSIKDVEVAALFREVGDAKVKVSLRSKQYVNVAEIARRHGGGGHKHAAGFTIKGDLAKAKSVVEQEINEALS